MSRFYVPPQNISDTEAVITGKEAHHMRNVQRVRSGDAVVIMDGEGNEFDGVIEKISSSQVKVRISSKRKVEDIPVKVCLAQSIPKARKFDFVVEKATELGVDRIIPFYSERTVPKPAGKESARNRRWNEIALQASKQCGRAKVPVVDETKGFEEVVKEAASFELALIAWECEKVRSIKEVLDSKRVKNLIVFVGPEGGFSKNEVEIAEKKGIIPVSIGRHVLRTETAPVVILAMLNYAYSI